MLSGCLAIRWTDGGHYEGHGGFVPANFKEDSLDVGTNFDPFEKQQEKGLSLGGQLGPTVGNADRDHVPGGTIP